MSPAAQLLRAALHHAPHACEGAAKIALALAALAALLLLTACGGGPPEACTADAPHTGCAAPLDAGDTVEPQPRRIPATPLPPQRGAAL